MHLVTLATCNLDQWALDFSGNLERVKQSIKIAKEKGARYRMGPELELSGYGCQDHFLETDTYTHSMECLAEILSTDLTNDILVDIGVPIKHKGVNYNCRIFVLNKKLLLIRPKLFLANDGNYRETRWFCAWTKRFTVEDFVLPDFIRELTGQRTVPIGDAIVSLNDTELAVETCEELFTPNSPNIYLGLDGVEIISNGSGSHSSLGKLHTRVDLIKNATAKNGLVYLYANQQGCDGDRLYFDGCAMISVNGAVLAQGSQFSLKEVEVVTANVDLDQVRAFRNKIASRAVQASEAIAFPRVRVDFTLKNDHYSQRLKPTRPIEVRYFSKVEEISLGPACYLFDYLRRSNQGGFFLPLSGGADSSSVAAIVGQMCQLIHKDCTDPANSLEDEYNKNIILKDIRRICCKDDSWIPSSPKEIANIIFTTCYMATVNSSATTRNRARKVAEEIGAHHMEISIDNVVDSMKELFVKSTGKTPRFDGTYGENIALQNIQARLRMVVSYFFAQLMNWSRDMPPKNLLVLGSSNVDEALRGYFTKYDCSSADINPIGSISKTDLKKFLYYAAQNLGYPSLMDVLIAKPTAELQPLESNQTDEEDMGLTYDELSRFGELRKIQGNGVVESFKNLVYEWRDKMSVQQIADKVKHFFKYYAINRHKMTTLTPAYHCESYSPEDNRFDLRQFLYNVAFPWQFKKIDELVKKYQEEEEREK
ncbi:hypothetical protein FDP41_007617 [Naegleria fowleri]|uniref:Glutamine-dependent NAD(+) synthetase n=1 Tax=Naegleria fowleri TaxID=5763 RepID=A0A6A5C9Q3_NAEFO|nr:uncharacterized protein FDP41_007617 [Naegleria fowleri]KAF0983702.1 hypothetical protein FDP41_007617 [Naegleria fowleri]CAG4710877.1 unnamed protein product [Naegleria fowleri]